MQVQGHEQAKALLKQVKAHTLLFVGPDRVGRRHTAKWYAAWLNCQQQAKPCGTCISCQGFLRDEHPDYREIAPELTTSTGRVNRRPEIKIGQLVPRKESDDPIALSRWLESRPSFNWRIAVIDSAHSLNISAANAFLKTLEEPPPRSKIILIAPSAEAMLATIASRSSIIRFAPSKALVQGDYPLARLGRFGDQAQKEDNKVILQLINAYVEDLSKTLEEAFEAADALQKQWENYPDAAPLLLDQFRFHRPSMYACASKAIESFSEALSAYASAPMAMQVLTLELRQALKTQS